MESEKGFTCQCPDGFVGKYCTGNHIFVIINSFLVILSTKTMGG